MSLAFIDPEINAFEFHDLDKDMSNIPDGGTEKSNHEIHQNFVIFGLSIVENNRVTHFREKNFSINYIQFGMHSNYLTWRSNFRDIILNTHAQASVYERHVVVSGKKLKNM